MKNATKLHDHATYKTKNAIFTFLCIFLISYSQISFADTEEYMDYDDFLFDVETLLEKNLKVQVPILSLDIPSKTINVDFQNLAIDVSQISRSTLKDISVLCNGTGAQCYLDVDGKLVRHPDTYPTYLIAANNATLWFEVGVAVSEEGMVYININEQYAINNIIETTGGTQSYISGNTWVNSTGTFSVAYAIGMTEYFAGWGFNANQDLAIKEALENCSSQISGLVNFSAKCESYVFDVPWW
jgi:hypothetical protein